MGNKDEADSIRVIHRALDAGVNFVDTADVYSAGESEKITGKALAGRRDDIVLATQVHHAHARQDTDVDKTLGALTDLVRQGKVRYIGSSSYAASQIQRKLDIIKELAQLADETGITLIELAIASAINHPAVTAAIIGPRTMHQLESQLPAAELTLTADVLDRINQLVAPGVTINPDDNSYGEAEPTPEALRRAM